MSEWQPVRVRLAHGCAFPEIERELKYNVFRVVECPMTPLDGKTDCDGKRYLIHPDDRVGVVGTFCEHEILTD